MFAVCKGETCSLKALQGAAIIMQRYSRLIECMLPFYAVVQKLTWLEIKCCEKGNISLLVFSAVRTWTW